MERIASMGVFLIGIGLIAGSIATTQGYTVAVVPAVLLVVAGMGAVWYGTYR